MTEQRSFWSGLPLWAKVLIVLALIGGAVAFSQLLLWADRIDTGL